MVIFAITVFYYVIVQVSILKIQYCNSILMCALCVCVCVCGVTTLGTF